MSHGKIRKNKNCLNCGHFVKEKYCPNCGQQNTETRQPFHYLFTHFFEDFTHYDGQFWGTLKNLVFKPGQLTKTYLEGKRQIFVPPVKLYIFISFVVFFLFVVFPPFKIDFNTNKNPNNPQQNQKNIQSTKKILEGLKSDPNINIEDSLAIEKMTQFLKDSAKMAKIDRVRDMSLKIDDNFTYQGYKTRDEYDKGTKNKIKGLEFLQDAVAYKFFELKESGLSKGIILKKLLEISYHNLPKALFIYLPIFALFLWVFHDKKKWWYFDHGVFTLHYFSFLLISILTIGVLRKMMIPYEDFTAVSVIVVLLQIIIISYSSVYFFIAHHRVYQSHGLISLIIGGFLFLLNFVGFLFLLIGLAIVSFLMMH